MMQVEDIKRELQGLANLEKAKVLQRFFKTGPGQYGAGDIFLGIPVPESRQVAKKFDLLPLQNVEELLYSGVHEERLVTLLILIQKYNLASGREKEKIVKLYLDNLRQVNNWDLVDLSAPNILGSHLMEGDRRLLYKLAGSDSVWERRIAIVATLQFIRNNNFGDTLKIAGMLLADRHDLIHKAAGWMLREVSKRDLAVTEAFLDKHYAVMPRTMLRYAIERFPKNKKRRYMKIAR